MRKDIEHQEKSSRNRNDIIRNNKKAIILVITCTLLTSVAQVLMKISTKKMDSIASAITSIPLILGLIIYALASVLLIIALRGAELSLVYPFIALSFVWVTLLSIFVFEEHVSPTNLFGIIAIIIGVSLIGRGGRG